MDQSKLRQQIVDDEMAVGAKNTIIEKFFSDDSATARSMYDTLSLDSCDFGFDYFMLAYAMEASADSATSALNTTLANKDSGYATMFDYLEEYDDLHLIKHYYDTLVNLDTENTEWEDKVMTMRKNAYSLCHGPDPNLA